MENEPKGSVIIAKRAAEAPVDTEEIEQLAAAAGYDVRDAITQVRAQDPGTNLGEGKVEELEEKLRVSTSVLDDQGVAEADVVTALNKVDLLDEETLDRRVAAARQVAPDVVPVSVLEGDNLDALEARVLERLPTERAVVELPNRDAAMSAVSWAYDHLVVEEVDYGEPIRATVSGRPTMVERFRAKAGADA